MFYSILLKGHYTPFKEQYAPNKEKKENQYISENVENIKYLTTEDPKILNNMVEKQEASCFDGGIIEDEFSKYKICRVFFKGTITRIFFEKVIASIDKKNFDIVEIIFEKGSYAPEEVQRMKNLNIIFDQSPNLEIAKCANSLSGLEKDPTGLASLARRSTSFQFNDFQIKLPREIDPIFRITNNWTWFSKSALEEFFSNKKPIKKNYKTGGSVLKIKRKKQDNFLIGSVDEDQSTYLLGFDKNSKNIEKFIDLLDQDYKILIFDGIKLDEKTVRSIFNKVKNKMRVDVVVKTVDGKSYISQGRMHIFFRNCTLPEDIKEIYLQVTHFNIYRFYEKKDTFLSDYKKKNPGAIVLQRFLKK